MKNISNFDKNKQWIGLNINRGILTKHSLPSPRGHFLFFPGQRKEMKTTTHTYNAPEDSDSLSISLSLSLSFFLSTLCNVPFGQAR